MSLLTTTTQTEKRVRILIFYAIINVIDKMSPWHFTQVFFWEMILRNNKKGPKITFPYKFYVPENIQKSFKLHILLKQFFSVG